MKSSILFLLGVMYVLNSIVMTALFPEASNDCYVYIDMTKERNKVYEFMFTVFFLVSFIDTKKRLSKSVACFFMILTCGSFIDKAIFGISRYLASDIILVIIALLISIYVYVREDPGFTK